MCPFCGCEETKVLDSRFVRDQHSTRRRRICGECERRFTTYERVERVLPTIIKRDGSRQPFNREKIRAGLVLACRKRPVTGDDMDSVISQVERHFAERPEREVASAAIGEQLLRVLRGVDEVAYVRFASVYREFSDVNHFVTELERLQSVDNPE